MTDFSQSISTEKIQRAALLILYDQLNDKLLELEETWTADDDEFFDHLDQVNPGWSVEPIKNDNFHSGTISGVLDRPVEEYPNVCSVAYLADPQGTNDDEGESYIVNLDIEVMVKSLLSESEVNSRIQKTLDAIHLVFLDKNYPNNETLNRLIISLPSPRKSIGDVFVGRQYRGQGDKWFWQAGRLQYNLSKFISFYS